MDRESEVKVCSINCSNPQAPKDNDEYKSFTGFDDWPSGAWRNWHSIPAAFETEFYSYGGKNFNQCIKYDCFLLSVNEDPHLLVPFVRKLKLLKKKVLIAYHESFQDFTVHCENLNWVMQMRQLVSESDGFWNISPNESVFFEEFFEGKYVANCLLAMPYDKWEAPCKVPFSEREGIFLGARSLVQWIARNSIVNLFAGVKLAKELDTFVTYQNLDGPYIEQYLKDIFGDRIRIVSKFYPNYIDWLTMLGTHKVILNFDMSCAIGELASDAAFVDVLALGGDSENSKINGTNMEDLNELYEAVKLAFHEGDVHNKTLIIKKKLCFESMKKEFKAAFEGIGK